jgi:predicted class III extradiol MEMO1 family dioxygenase
MEWPLKVGAFYMNKYLTKLAEQLDQNLVNIATPGKIAVHQSIAGILPDIGGMAAGNIVGRKFGLIHGSHNLGGMAGGILGGLAANYAVLKREQLKQKG